MKPRLLLSLATLGLVLTLPTFVNEGSAMLTLAESGYSIAPLPTTIDLNPVNEEDVRAYYSALDGKNLSGNELLKALKPILSNGQRYNSYDSGSNIWKAYEITDRDWTLSPASSTTYGTYDASANKIYNYEYGSGASNPKNNPYQHLFYRNRGVEEGYHRAWDKHGFHDGTDREHIWPKSHGFGKDPATGEESEVPGARGDLHHLVAGDSYVNSSTHNAFAYGFVDKNEGIKDDAGENYKINDVKVVDGNYRGTSLSLGSGTVFEPQDSDKGDIARACFYMVARYNNLAGDDPNIDGGNPNLFLDDTTDDSTIMSTATKAVSVGILRDLLAWNRLDPVDDYEIHRNDLIYRNFDHNRNPFIDYPQWADAVWGTVTLAEDNRTIVTRDENPSGVASPSIDPLYQGKPVERGTITPTEGKAALPTPVIIAIAVGAAIVLLIVVIVAVKGKGKAKFVAREILKHAAEGAPKKNSTSGTESNATKKGSSTKKGSTAKKGTSTKKASGSTPKKKK